MHHVKSDKIMLNAFVKFYGQLKKCHWSNPSDILKSFNSADIINCGIKELNRIVFNIGGNKYRLVCGYKFTEGKTILFVKFVGTHKEYDKIDVCKINMFKSCLS